MMDTFNEHLHLPVTKVDDAGEPDSRSCFWIVMQVLARLLPKRT